MKRFHSEYSSRVEPIPQFAITPIPHTNLLRNYGNQRRLRSPQLNLSKASIANIPVRFVKIEDDTKEPSVYLSLSLSVSLSVFLCPPAGWKKEERNGKATKKTVQRQPMAGLRSRSPSEDSEGIRCFDQVDISSHLPRHSIHPASNIFLSFHSYFFPPFSLSLSLFCRIVRKWFKIHLIHTWEGESGLFPSACHSQYK